MADNDKSLGLHQRIPLDILLEALRAEVNDELDSERVTELISTEYAGENRQKKGVRQVKSTLVGNPLVEFCKENKEAVLEALKFPSDRNLILSAIIAARYPICYDIYSLLAKQFRIQDYINTDLILRMLGTKYGANKSVYNVQINAVAQMLEAELIKRVKVGVYEFVEPQKPMCEITAKIWSRSYFINEQLANQDDLESLMFEPYFRYLRME